MIKINDYVKFGISPTMLFPKAFDDELEHLAAFETCCKFSEYESFETFLPHNEKIRKLEIQKMREHNKVLHYNTPIEFQLDGEFNPGSDNPKYRANALELAKKHINYTAEADSKLIVFTGCADKGPEKRPQIMERYKEYFLEVASYARQFDITIAIEPIEREVFKKLILGPTSECADFIKEMQEKGATNAKLMLDSAHLPLMEETFESALRYSMEAGLVHIHLGDSVNNSKSEYYGHTHPPIGIHGGVFDVEEVSEHFLQLFQAGFISSVPSEIKPTISLEMRPYPGVSPETSAKFAYEKVSTAFQIAAAKYGIV
jgi:sugar phosphate isomerase/epimerase